MIKITKTVAQKEDTLITTESSGGNTLKKTEVQTAREPTAEPADTLLPSTTPQYAGSPAMSEVADWLSRFLEADIIKALRENPNLQLAYTDATISNEEWLTNVLKTILTMEQIEAIGGHIQHKIIQVKENLQREKRQLQRQIEEKEQEIAQYQKQQAQLTSDLDKAEVATFRLEKNLAVMMEVKIVVSTFLYDPLDLQIKDIFVEATDNVTKDLAQFITQFMPQWVVLKTTLKKEYPTELEHTKSVHTVLSDVLQAISGLYIAQRRTLLDKIARLVSDNFNDYLFISPEESLQVDLNIHNGQGLGGTMIQEGISFAVLRKATRQTLIYADIKVH